MYYDIFSKANEILNLSETIYIKRTADTFYMHTYLTLSLCILFKITCKYISFVIVMILNINRV